MKRLKNFTTFVNESVRSLMKPKSEEEIRKSLDKYNTFGKLRYGIALGIPWVVKEAIDDKEYNVTEFFKFIDSKALFGCVERDDIEVIKHLLDAGFKFKDEFLEKVALEGTVEMKKLFKNNIK